MSILVAILGFNVLILVHELGHFLLARLSGMRVLKFSVGFGPAIVRFTRGTTIYQIAAFPVGGYVQIDGLGPGERGDDPVNFHNRPMWGRVATVLAGPVFNLAFAAIVYVFLFGTASSIYLGGRSEGTPLVRDVAAPAQQAGVLPGDLIERVGDRPVRSMGELLAAVGASEGAAVEVVVARPPAGESVRYEILPLDAHDSGRYAGIQMYWPRAEASWPRLTLTVTPEKTAKGYKLGVMVDYARFGAESWLVAGGAAVRETGALSLGLVRAIGRAFKGEEEVKLASAVKITEMGADTFQRGPTWFFQFLAFLSINLALVNLLPLPALDGGRLAFLLVEAVARRPINRRTEALIHGVGMLLLLGLIVLVTASDILSYF